MKKGRPVVVIMMMMIMMMMKSHTLLSEGSELRYHRVKSNV